MTVGLTSADRFFRPTLSDPKPLDYLPPVAIPADVQAAVRTRQSVRAQHAEALERLAAAEQAMRDAEQADRDDRVATILGGTAAGQQPAPSKQTRAAAAALLDARNDAEAHAAALDQAEWRVLVAVNAAALGDWPEVLAAAHADALADWQAAEQTLTAAATRLQAAAAALLWVRDWSEGRPSDRAAGVPAAVPPTLPDRMLDPSPHGRSTPRLVAVTPDGERVLLGDPGRADARMTAEAEQEAEVARALYAWQTGQDQ